jgi:hypothetical protein
MPIAKIAGRLCFFTIALSMQLPANAEERPAPPSRASDALVSVEVDKPEYFLGENVLLHWHIRNVGDEPFTFSIGGDGRTPDATRAIRFKIEVIDESGRSAPDPYPNPMNMGGPGGEGILEPSKDFSDDLQLMRYREITSPGTYTIKVYHDLGWEKIGSDEAFRRQYQSSDIPSAPRVAPVATTTVRFAMPNAEQAQIVVDMMLTLPKDANGSWGKRGQAFADFELLRYPIYLSIMQKMAEKGDRRGLNAIGAMAFPEATAALLELMNHHDAGIAGSACDMLLHRTPWGRDAPPSRGSYMYERSWNDELKKSAMASAWKLLATSDRQSICRGARIVQLCGNKNDLATLIPVMDRVLDRFKDDAVEQRAYPRPTTASESIANACAALLRHNAEPPGEAATSGQAVAWLLALGTNEKFRPDGWRETARRLVDHEIPFVREFALLNLPLPLDAATVPLVARAIEDKFEPVQVAACTLAGKAKVKEFGLPLTRVLERSDNDWVMRAAFGAAADCAVDNDERMEICIHRMRNRNHDWNMVMLALLIDASIENHHGSSWETIDDWTGILPGIRASWIKFIDVHRSQLRAGKRFPVAAPPLAKGMFPPGFRMGDEPSALWTEKP